MFAGLDDSELIKVANLCYRRIYNRNSVIFDPETPTEDIFILEGDNESVQIEIPINDPEDRIIIHTLSKGETFGWAALSSNHVRTAIARCLEEVRVIAINGKSLVHLLENNHHIGYLVMRNLADTISTRLVYTTVAFRHEIRKARKKSKLAVPP